MKHHAALVLILLAAGTQTASAQNNLSPQLAHGRQILTQNCNICHLPNFSGIENVPRLAGQREDYLLKSLRGYEDNSRRGYDAQMADVVAPLTDSDFADIAHFLARAR
jgi:cytochrome c553